MRIGIITFHASFNYGSMLQAYALHKVLSDMGHDVEIINFRSKEQREMYHYPIRLSSPEWSKPHMLIHYIVHFREYIPQIRKWNRYNSFLKKYLVHTKEFHTVEELKKQDFQYDYLFIGSDQIWNTTCRDFSEAYWGNFCGNRTKKIAYAPSMGPFPELVDFNKIKNKLNNFHNVSIREEKTRGLLLKANIFKDIAITLDPTLLLSATDYDKLISHKPLIDGEYIFFYEPFIRPQYLDIALEVSRLYKTKLIIDRTYQPSSYRGFKNIHFYTNVGPKEFLNLIKHAKLVVGHSLHAILFSIIFQKDFYAIDGNKDSRMLSILTCLGLEKRAIDINTHTILDEIHIKSWDLVYEKLLHLKRESLDYIKKSLEN